MALTEIVTNISRHRGIGYGRWLCGRRTNGVLQYCHNL
jgi:hypothetical protein